MRYYLMTLGVIFVAEGALAFASIPQETIACGQGIDADRCVAGTLVMQNDDFSSMRVLVVDTTYGTDFQPQREVAFDQSGAAFYSSSTEVRGLICSNASETQAFATLDAEGVYQSTAFGPISQDDMAAALLDQETCGQTFPGRAMPTSSGCGGNECSIFSSEMLSFHFLFAAVFVMGRQRRKI